MCASNRHLVALALLLAVGTLAGRASAWVESAVESDVVTIDVDRSGMATVAHELLVKVRGGPLLGIELAGIDADAEPLPDATVTAAGSGAVAPLPLLLGKKDDGTLRVEIDAPKGIRTGSYLFKLAYRTHLMARQPVAPTSAEVTLGWTGPRFDDGIDSARVVFRLPPAPTAPRLPAVGEGGEPIDGLFLATLRRAADKDELEVARPHIAKGEPVRWQVTVDARAFDGLARAAAPAEVFAPVDAPPSARTRALAGAIGLALLLVYAWLVMWKWRATTRACVARGGAPRALVPLPAAWRAVLAGTALTAAVAIGALTELPSLAGVLLLAAMALAVQLPPRAAPPLRAPGRWLPLSDEEAFAKERASAPGRWLDAGTPRGFLVFATLLGGFGGGALLLLPRSAYHALMLALASAVLLPIFCTGRARELPADLAREPRALLAYLARKLRKDDSLKVVAWARIPDGAHDPDELRLLVMPRRALAGLTALEIGVEYHHGLGGPIALPCVLVRAVDGSLTYRSLPRSVTWSRGRKPEERVAVLRPRLPTRGMCLGLVRRLAEMLSADAQPSRRSSSAGRGEAARKPATSSSPLHAM